MKIQLGIVALAIIGLLASSCREKGGSGNTAWQDGDWGVSALEDAAEDSNATPMGDSIGISLTPLSQGVNAFACDLYEHLSEKKGNLFFSPYSIASVLAMVYAGARGETERQMAEALHFDLGQKKLHRAFTEQRDLLTLYQRAGSIQLYQANSIWPQSDEPLLSSYLGLIRDAYGVEITPIDFKKAPESARKRINRWANEQTQGRIPEVIPPGLIDSLTRFVLGNAIYFQGNWAEPFLLNATKPAPFKLSPRRSRDVAMMYQKETLSYAEFEALQVLEIPHRGKDISMLVLLPKEVNGIIDLERYLTWKNLQTWRQAMFRNMVEVHLPRFEIGTDYRLDKAMQAIGMKEAFVQRDADFSGMVRRPDWLFITFVLHKTWIKVDEQGTEAAAVASVGGGRCEPSVFRADHPFLFLIQDNRTGMILFIGRVMDPS